MSLTKKLSIAALIIGWFLIGWFARGLVSLPGKPDADLISQARQIIASQYYGQAPSSSQMTQAAIRCMVASLGDKYSAYFEPVVAEHEILASRGGDGVTGLGGTMRAGQFIVTGVTPGGSAAEAGLRPDDWIREIDGVEVRGYDEAVAKLAAIEADTSRGEFVLLASRGGETQVLRVKLN